MIVGRYSLVLVMALLLGACSKSPAPTAAPTSEPAAAATYSAELDAFYEAFTDEWMLGDPDEAIEDGYFTDERQDHAARQVTPRSMEYKRARVALARRGLEELSAIDLEGASATQQRSAAVLRWQLEYHASKEPFLDYLSMPLRSYRGAGRMLVTELTVSHPFRNARDVENYVARMSQVGDRMGEATADAAGRAERGVLMPRFITEAAIEQLQVFVTTPPSDSPYITTLRDKSASVGDLDVAKRDALIAEATEIVETQIYPAWRGAIAELERQLPLTTARAGVSRLPDGDAFYAHQLAYYTSTDLTADEVHRIGLAQVEEISAQMFDLFDQVGIREGSIDERMVLLREQLAFPDDDEGRAAMMATLRAYLADARTRAVPLFDKMPKADVIIQPYPEFLWKTAAASYKVAPQDGSRPGIFQMPLRANRLSDFTARTLVLHETIPGHHFQMALLSENTELPRWMQLRSFGSTSASSEGWALYAERLAAEYGWYDDDPTGHLGQLSEALRRAKRLVVDTGLHTKGWTRQQAIDYGFSPSEIDRYVVWPGQACSYMIGQLKVLELRERARSALGENFSIREFHNAVLEAGVVPLAILEESVQAYIDAGS